MFNKKIIIGLILLLFLTCGVASAFDLFGDNLPYEDIGIDNFFTTTEFSNDSFVKDDGTIYYMYSYSAFYDLENVSSSLKGSEVITCFYNNNELLVFHDPVFGNFSNITTDIDDRTYFDDYSVVKVSAIAVSDNFVNITHFKVMIIKDGEVIFNATEKFNMSYSFENDPNLQKYMDNTVDDSSSSNSYSSSGTFVASSNSNKFHEPYCSQAQRISDANKITFSSRDEAINAGYEPCEICYP